METTLQLSWSIEKLTKYHVIISRTVFRNNDKYFPELNLYTFCSVSFLSAFSYAEFKQWYEISFILQESVLYYHNGKFK